MEVKFGPEEVKETEGHWVGTWKGKPAHTDEPAWGGGGQLSEFTMVAQERTKRLELVRCVLPLGGRCDPVLAAHAEPLP